jgi:hypothetical protein
MVDPFEEMWENTHPPKIKVLEIDAFSCSTHIIEYEPDELGSTEE